MFSACKQQRNLIFLKDSFSYRFFIGCLEKARVTLAEKQKMLPFCIPCGQVRQNNNVCFGVLAMLLLLQLSEHHRQLNK
uniref:Uncharacterized protein n=1 Tax=Octopus bimaculoides TaxID=37653 RepID=A0A0L8H606_OCTBM